jgi:hypothetical protein
MSEETLVPVFIPPLVTILAHHERQKGSQLTEDEVLAIRDKSVVIMMRLSHAKQMEQKRGYRDVDAEQCWEEWQDVRETL